MRPRCALERRLPSCGPRRAHGTHGSVLHRLSWSAAGVRLRGEARLSVPGTILFVAEAAPWVVDARTGRKPIRYLSPEPRPGREFESRITPSHADESRAPSCGHCAAPARST